MDEKNLDIAHYLADAIISDPSILRDESYLQSIPDLIGIRGKARRELEQIVREAVKAADSLTPFEANEFGKRLQASRSPYAHELAYAMKWAIRNKMMQQKLHRPSPSIARKADGSHYSEDSALDALLG